jgi:hypothetical protein
MMATSKTRSWRVRRSRTLLIGVAHDLARFGDGAVCERRDGDA